MPGSFPNRATQWACSRNGNGSQGSNAPAHRELSRKPAIAAPASARRLLACIPSRGFFGVHDAGGDSGNVIAGTANLILQPDWPNDVWAMAACPIGAPRRLPFLAAVLPLSSEWLAADNAFLEVASGQRCADADCQRLSDDPSPQLSMSVGGDGLA